ncbi:small ribosomal subunit protein uS17m-like [Mytilus galloprovincialis]|uniref:Small subunit ribosomal protein S17 n=1 Tax=Mytilus galloprovincialis TaxID=29158 RepID=A0A8B6GJ45_MYTGA|nr:small subunit ribosomal protein S17 [Mytilus galloprovincialis]
MASSNIRRFLIGQVIAKGSERIPSVQVRVPKMVLDKYLLMYFNHPDQFWAAETPGTQSKVGDIVKIQELEERASPTITHQVHEHVFKTGEIRDPVTGKRCRGMKYVDEEFRDAVQSKIENETGKWFS